MVHWHHLVTTTISLALLGYGVSGSFLALAGERLRTGFRTAFLINAVLFAAASVGCVILAQRLAFDPQALAWEFEPLWGLALTYLLLALPFFAAANCVGLALWRFPAQIPRLYGADLLGAGLGVLLLLLVLSLLPLGNALVAVGAVGLITAGWAAVSFAWRRLAVVLGIGVLAMLAGLWGRVEIQPSAYKDLARALDVLGAEVERRVSGVTGRVTVVANRQVPLRSAPGMSLQARALPPEQLAVFVDGDAHGTLLRLPVEDGPERDRSLAFLRDLTSALPYALLDRPRVLILGAGSGLAVLQARAHDARAVVAVESNPLLVELVCDPAADWSAALCRDPRIEWRAYDARAYLAERPTAFDLIVLSAEAERVGLNSQHETFGLTVEAFAAYLDHLNPGGLLAVDGATRLPPRLAPRMAATAAEALRRRGAAEPEPHLAMIRGWQRFALVASIDPLSPEQLSRIRSFADQRGFDRVWLPDIQADEVNRYQQLGEPWFHAGVRDLLTATDASDLDEHYRLSPATDDRPFPYRFSPWSELLDRFTRAPSTRTASVDLGLLLGAATLLLAVVASLVLILLPLLFRRRAAVAPADRRSEAGWRWRTLAYFGLIGLAFLFVEIAWIHRLQRFLGQPIYATAFVLAVFLVFAGLGAAWSQRRPSGSRKGRLTLVVIGIALLSLAYLAGLDAVLERLAYLQLPLRALVTVGVLAPLAFAMGVPFPLGLQRLSLDAEPLVPWAWGINGCASVISAAAAPLLAMEIGFSGLVLTGVVCYLLLIGILPREDAQRLNAAV